MDSIRPEASRNWHRGAVDCSPCYNNAWIPCSVVTRVSLISLILCALLVQTEALSLYFLRPPRNEYWPVTVTRLSFFWPACQRALRYS